MYTYQPAMYESDAVRAAVALLKAHLDGDRAGQDVLAGSAGPDVVHVLCGMTLSAMQHAAAGMLGESEADGFIRSHLATFLERLPAT